eukprot:309076-Rhodomonas_salina.4
MQPGESELQFAAEVPLPSGAESVALLCFCYDAVSLVLTWPYRGTEMDGYPLLPFAASDACNITFNISKIQPRVVTNIGESVGSAWRLRASS